MSPERARLIAETMFRQGLGPDAESEIAHAQRVAATVLPEARSVAWLHDVAERTSLTAADLRAAGLGATEIEALALLTRDGVEESDEEYMAHVGGIAEASGPAGRLARHVKVADLADRIEHPLPRPNGWTPPYAEALDVLESGAAAVRG